MKHEGHFLTHSFFDVFKRVADLWGFLNLVYVCLDTLPCASANGGRTVS